METTRTTAGYELWRQGVDTPEIKQRVRVRVVAENEEGVEIETSLDGGEWENEGWYKK